MASFGHRPGRARPKVFRAYFEHAFLKQYEKFSTLLRSELCSNNLKNFGLKKSLDNLQAVREKFQIITSGFAYQAQWLNVHVDFPLLQRRPAGPLANCRLEAAYHRADAAIQKVVDLLAAA